MQADEASGFPGASVHALRENELFGLSMRSRHVEALIGSAPAELGEALVPRITSGELLEAPVTAEITIGGHLLSAQAALQEGAGGLAFERFAPVVTGRQHAGGFPHHDVDDGSRESSGSP